MRNLHFHRDHHRVIVRNSHGRPLPLLLGALLAIDEGTDALLEESDVLQAPQVLHDSAGQALPRADGVGHHGPGHLGLAHQKVPGPTEAAQRHPVVYRHRQLGAAGRTGQREAERQVLGLSSLVLGAGAARSCRRGWRGWKLGLGVLHGFAFLRREVMYAEQESPGHADEARRRQDLAVVAEHGGGPSDRTQEPGQELLEHRAIGPGDQRDRRQEPDGRVAREGWQGNVAPPKLRPVSHSAEGTASVTITPSTSHRRRDRALVLANSLSCLEVPSRDRGAKTPPECIIRTVYARVALPAALPQALTYLVPEPFLDFAAPGCRVRVRLRSQLKVGVILSLGEDPGCPPEVVRPLEEVLDLEPLLPAHVLALISFAADYYVSPPGLVTRAAVPPGRSRCRPRCSTRTAR